MASVYTKFVYPNVAQEKENVLKRNNRQKKIILTTCKEYLTPEIFSKFNVD